MKRAHLLTEGHGRSWHVLARDVARRADVIDTNEYLVVDGDQALLCDPGGLEVFPSVFAAVNDVIDARRISTLFASHQDPDVISSLGLWLEITPTLTCYVSALWVTFLSHFGGTETTFRPLPDDGATIPLGSTALQAIPAHYLHSSGNLHLYDRELRVLFTGDVGAALLPPDLQGLVVEDFDRHIEHATYFHRRWMGSREAKDRWCERVSSLPIDFLCPQHGAVYTGDDVSRFLEWFHRLPVGMAS